jgi:hypothetical protein
MRHPVAPAALALLLACAPAFAQVGPDHRFVSAEQAEVRSGPSTSANFYVTNRLRRGQGVEVIGELPGGWLKIRPPEGSFSYINTRFLKSIVPNQDNYVVALEGVEVPVFMGSQFVNDHRPTVVGVSLKRGAQVISIGKPLADSEGEWMPIEPPPGEGRYLLAESVSRTAPLPGGAVVTTTGRVGSAGGPTVLSNAPSANLPASPEELWQRARQAEASGNRAEAIRLFYQLNQQAASSNPTLAKWALDWAHYLQSGHAAYGASTGVVTSGATGPLYPLTAEDPGVRLNPPPGARVAWNDPRGSTFEGTATLTRSAAPASRSVFTPAKDAQWVTYRGRLQPAGRAVEGQKTYRLEMEMPGYVRPVAYVGSGPAINLSPYVGKLVEVQGSSFYHGDLKTNYLTVTSIRPLER